MLNLVLSKTTRCQNRDLSTTRSETKHLVIPGVLILCCLFAIFNHLFDVIVDSTAHELVWNQFIQGCDLFPASRADKIPLEEMGLDILLAISGVAAWGFDRFSKELAIERTGKRRIGRWAFANICCRETFVSRDLLLP
jgi:hypothetical protein